MENINYEAVLEAILFTMGKAVELDRLASAIELPKDLTRGILGNMIERYEKEEHGVQLIELDGSYQMCTKPAMYEYLIRIASLPKKYVLTDAQVEALSIIAYKQPVTKAEIDDIRGVTSGYVVNRLVEFGLVCEVGRLDAPGRPLLFGTTEEFLRSFGVHSLEELPRLGDDKIREFKKEAEDEIGYVSEEESEGEIGQASEEESEGDLEQVIENGQ